jgi:ribosomal protein S18 acetylase RimI-like enzyme
MDDDDVVSRLLREVDELRVRLRPDVFPPFDDPDQMRERVAGFVEDADAEIIVAELGADIVGLATIRVHDNPDASMFRPGRFAIMADLVVVPEFRRSGIAKSLLDSALEWTWSRGLPGLGINVWNDNESGVSFFEANGFAPRCQQMELKIEKD